MITNDEKTSVLINRLNNLEAIIQSYIDHAEEFKDKYSLEEVLAECSIKKTALLQELNRMGGTWINP